MKKHLNYWLALALLLPALHACHDEDDAMPGEESGTAGKATVVRASIGDDGSDTRAQVQWGTQNVADGEFFMWNAGDQFKAYDITTAERNVTPSAYTFSIDGNYNEATPSREADFTCPDFPSVAQHKIAALYGDFEFREVVNENGMKGINFFIEHTNETTQIQTDNPGNADLEHLKNKMPMWATATAEGNGKLSQVSFHHMSALFRVTLRNAGDAALQVEQVKIYFPDTNISVGGALKLWENHTKTWTSYSAGQYATLYLNNKNGNQYATIASGGGSYDCFLPVLTKDDEYNSGTRSLRVKVKLKDDPTVKSVDIAGLNNYKIEAGMRYWFDLTVMADGTLAQTSSMQTNYAWYTSNKEATEFSISTPGELRALANLVNGTEEAKAAAGVSGAVSFEGKTIRLAGDINLGNEAWTPIGSSTNNFRGTFDGDGRHISGLNVDNGSNDNAGLFGHGYGSTVRNLRVSGKVTTTGYNAGGIAGILLDGCIVENCIFDGDVSGDSYVGGIAGENSDNCRIAGCHTKGTVTATNSYAGGIAGFNFKGTIDGCYSEAEVTADRSAGGIAGDNSDTGNNSGNITYCYATGAISGKSSVGGIAGYQNPDATLIGGIALNPGITRTSGSMTSFGRIAGLNNGTVTSSAAFSGMTLVDATTNTDITGAIGEAGDNLTAADCLAKDSYTSRGFTDATATTPGWAFDTATPWTYLPWNKAFEAFPGISETDYRIKVPPHLNGGGTVN